jgi:hypothetical protein
LREAEVTGIIALPVISADTEETEEFTMYPYQLSKVLTDQHIHDLMTTAERHEVRAAARRRQINLTAQRSRFKALTAQVARTMAHLVGRSEPGVRPSMTSLSDAGPVGCSA